MFEQSILAAGPAARKTGAVFASFAAQIAGVGVLICVPLIYSDTLPRVKLAMPLARPMAAAPPIETRKAPEGPAVASVLHANSSAQRFRLPVPNERGVDFGGPVSLGVDGAPSFPPGDGTAPTFSGFTQLPTLERPRPPAEKAPPAPPTQPVSVGGEVQAAKILKKIIPSYPSIARQSRVSGTVRLMGVIAKDGTVQKLQVVNGNPLLVRAALDAVSQWIYKPTILNGNPVEVVAPIDVIFILQ
jgi:protein TonB